MADPFMQALAGSGTLFEGSPINMTPDMNLAGLVGVQGPQAMLLNMALQPLVGQLVGDKYMSAQFLPQGNLYNQFRQKQLFQAQQQIMRRGSEFDQDTYRKMFQGMATAAGTPFGFREARAADTLSRDLSQIMPMLAPIAPELFDRLHGSKGSAMIMAQQMNMGGRYMLDPLTGRTGYTADSAVDVTKKVFDRLYGADADVREMRGVGAGRAGQMFDELSRRGLMGTGMTRDRAIDEIARKEKTTADELRKLDSPSIDSKLREFEAARIGDKLKSMAGAVSAMQDIFGEMGQPDAPMSMLINGLQTLTQNGLQTMDPRDVERLVRTTANVARSSGLSMETMMRLTAEATGRTDALGLDRRFAATSAQSGAAFGQAFGASFGQLKVFGAADKEKALAMGTQLSANAAASPIAQQLATLTRLGDEFGGFTKGSEAEALYRAVKRGDTEYTFDGQTKSVYKPTGYGAGSFMDIMNKGGKRADLVEKVRVQAFENQRAIAENNLQDSARALQGRADIEPRLFQTIGSTVDAALTPAMREDTKLREAMQRAAAAGSANVLDYSKDELDAFFNKGGEPLANRMLESLKAQGVAVTPEIEERVREAARLSVGAWRERAAVDPGLSGYGAGSPAGAGVNALTMHNRRAMKEARLLKLEAGQEARMQEAGSRLGRGGPAQNLMDAIQNATPGTKIADIIAKTLGMQDVGEVSKEFSANVEAMKKEMDDFRNVDPAKIRAEINAALAAGGGPAAAAVAAKYGVDLAKLPTTTDRELGIQARQRIIERFESYMPKVAKELEKKGFRETKVTQGDMTRAWDALKRGDAGAADQSELLAERIIMDDGAMQVLGGGGLDRVLELRRRAQSLRELSRRYTGGDVNALMSGNFDVRAVDLSDAGIAKLRAERGVDIARLREELNPANLEKQRAEAAKLRAEADVTKIPEMVKEAEALERTGNPESVKKAREIRAGIADRRNKLTKAGDIERQLGMSKEDRAKLADQMQAGLDRLPADAADVKSIRTELAAIGGKKDWTEADATKHSELMTRLTRIADERYGGNVLGLLGDSPEAATALARAAARGDTRAIELLHKQIGADLAKGRDRSKEMPPEEKKKWEDTRRMLTLDSGGAVDELLKLTGVGDLSGTYQVIGPDGKKRDVSGKEYLANQLQGRGLQDQLPALKRLSDVALSREAEKELRAAGQPVTPEAIAKKAEELAKSPDKRRQALADLINADPKTLTEEQRKERDRIIGGADSPLAKTLRELTGKGKEADAKNIAKDVNKMPDLSKDDKAGDPKAGAPVTVKFDGNTRLAGELDITTGHIELRPIGHPGT